MGGRKKELFFACPSPWRLGRQEGEQFFMKEKEVFSRHTPAWLPEFFLPHFIALPNFPHTGSLLPPTYLALWRLREALPTSPMPSYSYPPYYLCGFRRRPFVVLLQKMRRRRRKSFCVSSFLVLPWTFNWKRKCTPAIQ